MEFRTQDGARMDSEVKDLMEAAETVFRVSGAPLKHASVRHERFAHPLPSAQKNSVVLYAVCRA